MGDFEADICTLNRYFELPLLTWCIPSLDCDLGLLHWCSREYAIDILQYLGFVEAENTTIVASTTMQLLIRSNLAIKGVYRRISVAGLSASYIM